MSNHNHEGKIWSNAAQGVNRHSGPGEEYAALDVLEAGQPLIVLCYSQGEPVSFTNPFQNLILNEEQGYSTFKEEAPFKEILGADCSDEEIEWAKSLLGPEPLAPSVTPVHITAENYNRVPRVYIETLRDRAISPSLQKKMYTALPCQKIISMETSHASFFSAPEELVRHLSSLEPISS